MVALAVSSALQWLTFVPNDWALMKALGNLYNKG